MLGESDAIATIAVKKLAPAKKFYEEILGLKLDGPQKEKSVAQYRSGKSRVLVYESEYAGTNKADFKTAWFKDPDGNILSIISS